MDFTREHLEEKGLVGKKTNAVYDYEFIKALKKMPWSAWLDKENPFGCQTEYLEEMDRWIASSQLNSIQGLQRFPQRHLINGTTQTFDEAYFKYKEKRLRFFRGEYAYHRRVVDNWCFLEDEPLKEGDYVIVSAPFCSTGEVHPLMMTTLNQAEKFNVPVIVDCAYFGTCTGLKINLDHPAIESVSFSLSKGLGLGDIRSGVRYSNIVDELPICQQNNYSHTVLAAAKMGLYMMRLFSPDHIPNKFQESQKSVCRELGVQPTNCMHIALGDDRWMGYRIDDLYYRIGIRNLVKARYKHEV